ncbi:hypothetical protein ElyMa_001852100 [Elysia marginata]|uniref:Uncharacterized protein n=1 Tax=Elysia marginata TaxID=1093978 RepID=A0AAV4ELE1_9GAST|nr:hypothetical protein ElyMa_001852100 [Elysia marginata]
MVLHTVRRKHSTEEVTQRNQFPEESSRRNSAVGTQAVTTQAYRQMCHLHALTSPFSLSILYSLSFTHVFSVSIRSIPSPTSAFTSTSLCKLTERCPYDFSHVKIVVVEVVVPAAVVVVAAAAAAVVVVVVVVVVAVVVVVVVAAAVVLVLAVVVE